MAVPHPAPTVTIILPCYNLEAHIGAAIHSVRVQDLDDFEALVIDDGSNDATAQAAGAAIAGDARFKLIQRSHQGLSAARNAGLDAARGGLIAFLDGDDTFAPDFLSAHCTELGQSGAAWTSSALCLVWPDGRVEDHSALHGAPRPEGDTRWIDLNDARQIAQLFPSVWNKVYRRDLIGDTRFVEDALFEDHPFFWALACKAGRIRYLPQPLYRYTRGRPGQITDLADTAMFQQLDRLREVAEIVQHTPLTHLSDGMSRLATRVIHERLALPALETLKAQFISDAALLMAQEGLHWDRAGAYEINPHPAPQLDPEMRLSVLVMVREGSDPAPTLQALQAQDLPIWDILCLDAHARAGIASLLDHLPRSAGAWLACLQAGDIPAPDWASTCLEGARAQQATCVIVGARHSGSRQGHDTGLALRETLLAAPDPAMLVMHKRALEDLPDTLRDALGALPDPVAAACLTAHLSKKLFVMPTILLVTGPRPTLSLAVLAKALARAPDSVCPLPQQARATVFAHLAQMRLARASTRPERLAIAMGAGIARHSAALPSPATADHIGPYLRLCLGRPSSQNKPGRSRK